MHDGVPAPEPAGRPRAAVGVAVGVEADAARRAAPLPEEERLRLGLPMKLPLQASGRQRSRAGGGGAASRSTGLLVVTARRVMLAPTHGPAASVVLEEPFQAHLSRWDVGRGEVELGVTLRQGDQTLALCVRLGADEVDAEALALRELDAPRLSAARFAPVWELLVHYARLHGEGARLGAVRPRPRAQARARARVDVAKPERFLVRDDVEGLTMWAKAPPERARLVRWLKVPQVAIWVAVAIQLGSIKLFEGFVVVVWMVCALASVGVVYASMVGWRRLCRRDACFRGRVIVEGAWLRVTGLVEAGEASDVHRVELGALEQLYVASTEPPERSTKHLKALALGPPLPDHAPWYALCGLGRDGSQTALVGPLELDEALFMELVLERRLGIDDRAVGGERVLRIGEPGGLKSRIAA